MTAPIDRRRFRCAVLSAVKHDYVARGMARHPRFELIVVADDPGIPNWAHERNQEFAESFGIPYVRDVERAISESGCDVAIVSPEAERHVDLSVRAARAGLHVVQDKPLTTSSMEADRLVQEFGRAGVRFLMWNRNGLPAIQQARRLLDGGAIGELIAMHVDFYFAKDAGPPIGSRKPGYPPLNWEAHQIAAHADGSDGGLGRKPMGELEIEGIYPLGYLQYLSGRAAKRVFACGTAHFHQLNADHQVEDLASVTLELEGGPLASLAIGRIGAASHPSGGEIKLHMVGTAGALVINEARPDVGIHYRDQPPREARRRRVAGENDFLLADDFARAIDEARPTLMDVQASKEIFRTIQAALQSCRSGQPVAVPD